MVDPTLPLPGLSSVAGKEIVARFDGGRLSSDGGLLVLRAIEQRLKVAERPAAGAGSVASSPASRPVTRAPIPA